MGGHLAAYIFHQDKKGPDGVIFIDTSPDIALIPDNTLKIDTFPPIHHPGSRHMSYKSIRLRQNLTQVA